MIIDTMVVAYALLKQRDYGLESAEALRKADELTAPASVEAELLNVFWQWGQLYIPPSEATAFYVDAAEIWDKLIPVKALWPSALSLAFERSHSPYDTLFVAAARMRGTKVLTYDKNLLKRFPEDTMTVADFLR